MHGFFNLIFLNIVVMALFLLSLVHKNVKHGTQWGAKLFSRLQAARDGSFISGSLDYTFFKGRDYA